MHKIQIHSKILGGFMLLAAISGLALATFSVSACGGSDPTGPVDTSQILVSAPKGGETFKVGQTLYVKWKLQGKGITDIASVDVSLSPDNGKRWQLLVTNSIVPSDPTWGNFPYVIPDSIKIVGGGMVSLKNNSECRIRVKQYNSSDPLTMTITNAFTITP